MGGIKKVTFGEIIEFRSKMVEEDLAFSSDYKIIGKYFLKEVCGIEDAFRLSFKEIESESKKVLSLPLDNSDEETFYMSICTEYLSLEKHPSISFFKYYNEALKHLNEIDDNISFCERELRKSNNNYYKNMMIYFIEKNKNQKDEIASFLRNGIKWRAINDSTRSVFSSIVHVFDVPYHFYFASPHYDPRQCFNVEVKFGDLPIMEFKKIRQIYQKNQEEYYDFLKKYIAEKSICDEIIKKIKADYFLESRLEIIETAIDSFIKGRYLVFINLIVIQIEGIFQEYCRAIGLEGIDEKNITLVDKINRINEIKHFFGYEYFVFEFPILRNKIAHGKLLNSIEVTNIANEILLDLNYLVGIFRNRDLPTNQLVKIIKDLENGKSNNYEISQYLFEGAKNNIVLDYLFKEEYKEIFKFYKIDDKTSLLIEYLKKEDVWDSIIKELEDKNSMFWDKEHNKNVNKLVEYFMCLNDYKNQCIKIKRKLNDIKNKFKENTTE